MKAFALAAAGWCCVTYEDMSASRPTTQRRARELRRDAVLNLRVPRVMKVALERAAIDDDRSLSSMAVQLLRTQLTALGYLEKE